MWCIPKMTPEYIDHMNDVLKVYERPYNQKYPVVCYDEKLVELRETPRGEMAARPGKYKKVDYEYQRNGTAQLLLAVEPKGGKRSIKTSKRRTQKDIVGFLQYLSDQVYRRASKITLVCDQLNVHGEEAIFLCMQQEYGEKEANRIIKRFSFHYTPVHGSWLNAAEIEFSILGHHVLDQRTENISALRSQVKTFEKQRNRSHAKIHWNFSRKNAEDWLEKHFQIKEKQH